MSLTTAQLVTRCEARFHDNANEVVSNTEWIAYLNEAYQEVNAEAALWPWNRLQQTLTYTTGNNLGVIDAYEVYSVTAVYNATLEYSLSPLEDLAQYRYYYPDNTQQGPPRNYRWTQGGQLELWPVPDGSYDIIVDYVGSPPDLDTTSSNPLWPLRFQRILVELALSRAYMDDGNADWAKMHRDLAEKMLNDMRHFFLAGTLGESYARISDDDWYE